MPRGRRALPAAVHALRGNPGKRKLKTDPAGLPPGKPQSVEGSVVELRVPPPPSGLSAPAKAYWRAHAPLMVKRGLLRDTDLASFETLCRLEAEDRKLSAILAKDGAYYVVNQIRRRHPAVADQQKVRKDLRDYRDRFGLSPAMRARVTMTPDPQQPGLPLQQPAGAEHDRPPASPLPAGNPLEDFIADRPRLAN